MMQRRGNRLPFDEVDPFNGNRVRGHLLRSRRRRGDLEISHVNEHPVAQTIRTTPRIAPLVSSPPVTCERIKAFEKIDGTNVLLFRYVDASGRSFVSYKTRQSAFLRPLAYGDFVDLWNEIREAYQEQLRSLIESPYFFGFELFGRRARILTDYETPLDARLLYALDPATGDVIDPESDAGWRFPVPEKLVEMEGTESWEAVLDAVSDATRRQYDLRGSEGAILYCLRGHRATLRKHKPPPIQARQAQYRDLYAHAKSLTKTCRDIGTVLDSIRRCAEQHWHAGEHDRDPELLETVQDDIACELTFQDSAVDDSAGPAVLETDTFGQMVMWRSVWGSHMWGMDHERSDRDVCVVYQIDHRTLVLGAFERERIEPHLVGRHRRVGLADEHWYELGRAVQLLLDGSLTMLLGVISPLVEEVCSSAHRELVSLIHAQPSRAFYPALLRDVRDSERMMRKAADDLTFVKHLRIACRNLRFAITLFSEGRFALEPHFATRREELDELKRAADEAYRASRLPAVSDADPFREYVLRWRRHRSELDWATG